MQLWVEFLFLSHFLLALSVATDSVSLDKGFGFELLMTKLDSLEKRVTSVESLLENRTNAVLSGQLEVMKELESQIKAQQIYDSCDKVPSRISGTFRIKTNLRESAEVFCEQEYDNGGWTVIQNRFDGSVNFYRNWNEYKRGFGRFDGEFWLGLDLIHELTYSGPHELVVLLEDFEGNATYAKLDRFEVAGEQEAYQATIAKGFSGPAGDSITSIATMKFSTLDRDNDTYEGSCASRFHGAWWYAACHSSNLNGKYLKGQTDEYATGMVWNAFRGYHYSLKSSRMMIRRKKN